MKVCTSCLKLLDESFFYFRHDRGYYQTSCKLCCKQKNHVRYLNNKEHIKQSNIRWVKNNPEKAKLKYARFHAKPENKEKAYLYRKANDEKIKNRQRGWRQNNKQKLAAKRSKERSSLLKRTPTWLTKDQIIELESFYKNCPFGMTIDHIVPLQGKLVSGLHVPWNLQYLPGPENFSKQNRFEPLVINYPPNCSPEIRKNIEINALKEATKANTPLLQEFSK